VGSPGGRNPDGTPRFDQAVAPGSYLWWYVDGVSDCGRHAITLIAFVGSVFSPYYAWARERSARSGTPLSADDYCAINIALYSPGQNRWTMTERAQRHTERSARRFRVGPSAVHWDGRALRFDLNERSAPVPLPVRGQVTLHAEQFFSFQAPLDAAGRHRWGPLAPSARIEVDFESPRLSWRGHGYLDSNEGDEPVENAFESWDWARAALSDGSCGVVYDARPTSGDDRILALRFNTDGSVSPFDPGPRQRMARTGWGIRRQAHSSADNNPPRVTRSLQDTPFYVRSLIETSMADERVVAMHETLESPRLRSPLVRLMLPFRMPRRG
ncbi:MAG: hypothetical protein RLZZ153_552, partial [Pseudomonadota bacterium]